MALFEFDDGRLFPAQFGRPVAGGLTSAMLGAVRAQVLEIVSRPLFPITWHDVARAADGAGEEPRLTALDASGQVVSVEVIKDLDSGRLIASLSRLADTAALSWTDLAREYPGGPDGFKRGWVQFRDSMPPTSATGPRLILVVGSIDAGVRPALDVLATSGVEVHEISLRQMSNGRTFLDVQAVGPRQYGHSPNVLVGQARDLGRLGGYPSAMQVGAAPEHGRGDEAAEGPAVSPDLDLVQGEYAADEPAQAPQPEPEPEQQRPEPAPEPAAPSYAPEDRRALEAPGAEHSFHHHWYPLGSVGAQPAGEPQQPGPEQPQEPAGAQPEGHREQQEPTALGGRFQRLTSSASPAPVRRSLAERLGLPAQAEQSEPDEGGQSGSTATTPSGEVPLQEPATPLWLRRRLGQLGAPASSQRQDAAAQAGNTVAGPRRSPAPEPQPQAEKQSSPLERDARSLQAIAEMIGADTPLSLRPAYRTPTGARLGVDGRVRVSAGEFTDPTEALEAEGRDREDGWTAWRLGGPDGPTLADALAEVNSVLSRGESEPGERRGAHAL